MDDEIVVGVKKNTKKAAPNKKKKTSKKAKKGKVRKQAKILFGIFIFVILVFLLLCSPLFDIKNIQIEGNQKLSNEKITSISTLQLHTNIFKFNKGLVKEKIKENAYIESVEITRSLPSTVDIKIKERTPKYMLQFADSYVYINNQGYMLEISNEKLDIPVLVGFTTDLSNIKAGNRINVTDLKKMDMVIKIYEAANSNELGNLVTKIDISNDKNYAIILETDGNKKVYLGDCTDLNTRILYLKTMLKTLSGKSGEVFLNVDLNVQDAYFRPSSN